MGACADAFSHALRGWLRHDRAAHYRSAHCVSSSCSMAPEFWNEVQTNGVTQFNGTEQSISFLSENSETPLRLPSAVVTFAPSDKARSADGMRQRPTSGGYGCRATG